MAEDLGARAAGLLIGQAWADHAAGRYQAAVAAASRAVEAARLLDDPALLVRALRVEASALMMLGDYQAALTGFTQILGLAEDPASRSRLDDLLAAETVAAAHWGWTECARNVPGIPVRELFRVLDAAERWLAATGHRDWRAAILNQRAQTHNRLGEKDAAAAAAEEALAVALQHPDAPGITLAGHRTTLGDILRLERATDAAAQYQAVLADPDSAPWERRVAHKGLAWCAFDAGDLESARREAQTAVLLAEQLGDGALCTSLEVLAETCLGAGDLDAAWEAAIRHLESAGRVGGHAKPYYAVRTAVDVALAREDFPAARRLLGEMQGHAAAMDVSTGTTMWTDETARRRRRLADAEQPLA